MADPRRWHEKHHRFYRCGVRVPFEDCWHCGRQRWICKQKQKFGTWIEAEETVQEILEREAYTRPVTRYHCPWCGGWHITSHPKGLASGRAEKRRRKWLTAQEIERRKAG